MLTCELGVDAGVWSSGSDAYYGKLIGSLESQVDGIRGDVYAVDARTLFVKGFSYDGQEEPGNFTTISLHSLDYNN